MRRSQSDDIPGVVQVDLDPDKDRVGQARIEPWQNAAAYGEPGVREGDNANRLVNRSYQGTVPLPDKLVRRTPAERVASVAGRLAAHMETHGTLPKSLVDVLVQELGAATGRQITGEDIRALAQFYMEQAAAEDRLAKFGQVTDTTYSTPTPVIMGSNGP